MDLPEFVDALDKYKYFQETEENPMVFIKYDASNASWIVDGIPGTCANYRAFSLRDAIKQNICNILQKINGTIHYIIPAAKNCMKINSREISYYIIDNNIYFDIEHVSKLFLNKCYFSEVNEKAHSKISRKSVRVNKELHTVFLNVFAHSEYPVFGFTVNTYGGLTIRNLISYQECFEILKQKNIDMHMIKFDAAIKRNSNYITQVNNIPALPQNLSYNGEVVYIRVVCKRNSNTPYIKIAWTKNWLLYQNDTTDEDIFGRGLIFQSKNICIKPQSIQYFNKICELMDLIEPSIKYQHINNKFSLIENKYVDDYVSKIYYYHPSVLEYFNSVNE